MMDMTAKMRDEIRRRKAAQAATGLSALLTDELRHIPGRFAEIVRGARQYDAAAVRGKAVGYAGQAMQYAGRAKVYARQAKNYAGHARDYAGQAGAAAAKTYEHLAARGRDAMAGKGH
ncbi:MAG TPA: hypothetical protein VKV33_03280 [Streptosporangiaceae bacterium]|nr:hypothetical protein [Streptosporangiaceae bacterium]